LSLRGDVLGARAALEPALPFYEVHPLERFSQTGTRSIWCHGHMAHANCLSGDLERAKTHADRAVTLAEETGRPLDKVFSMHCIGEVLLECESYAAAAEILEEAMGIAEHVNSPLFTVWLGCDIIPAYIALGRIEPARQILARQEPEARRLSLRQFAACLALRRGEIALVDGREDEAAKQAEAALLTARSAGYFVIETAALRVGGSIERLRGETTSTLEAAAALAEARGLAGEARRARASGALPYGAPGTI
jgi:ATP/maltotriose-dependent transcriptional regulator MalT